jgi:hypothetical protein
MRANGWPSLAGILEGKDAAINPRRRSNQQRSRTTKVDAAIGAYDAALDSDKTVWLKKRKRCAFHLGKSVNTELSRSRYSG